MNKLFCKIAISNVQGAIYDLSILTDFICLMKYSKGNKYTDFL